MIINEISVLLQEQMRRVKFMGMWLSVISVGLLIALALVWLRP